MNDKKFLNAKSDVEDYQFDILQSKINKYQNDIELFNTEIKMYTDFAAKFYTALSKRVGYTIDQDNVNSIVLPETAWGDVYDEVFEKQDCLIRPSHSMMPYSFINKKPDLQEYIPVQIPRSTLELLCDKSTSRAFEIINEQTSENTLRAHAGDLIYWQAWLSAVGFNFYESVKEKDIITFIIQHAEGIDSAIDVKLVSQGYKSKLGPHKLATIKRRVASLSVFLDSVKWENSSHTKEIKNLFYKLTKKYGSSKPAGKAITKDILDDMIDTCKDKLIDLRDKALLLFAWGSGGRRRAEVSSAAIQNLTQTPEGDFVYNIPQSKTDQEGKGYNVPIKGRVAKALNDWLCATGIREGAIFRSVKKGGQLGRELSDVDVYRIVKLRLKKAGYDETQFGAHSLRSGFVTEAGRRQKPLGDVMAMTTHKNVGTVMKYYQAGNIINNSAANLAD